MAKKNDQVFQLSLTEIAFTLVFIILLLLGWMVFKSEDEKKSLEKQVETASEIKSTLAALNQAKQSLMLLLSKAGVAKPDEIVSELVSPKSWTHEREKLENHIDDLDRKITILAEVRDAIAKASEKEKATQEQIESALFLQSVLTEKLNVEKKIQYASNASNASSISMPVSSEKHGRDAVKAVLSAIDLKMEIQQQLKLQLETVMDIGKEVQIAKELVDALHQVNDAKKTIGSPGAIKKENADLRGQVAFLKGKLDARGGRDYPPCWAEESTGKIEFLFTIEIQNGGLLISPGWPTNRDADARALPGSDQLLVPRLQSLAEFNEKMIGINAENKAKNCRHYVYVKNRANQLDVFNRYRYGIENFFYKLELRS